MHDDYKHLEETLATKNELIANLEKKCDSFSKQDEIIKELNESCTRNKKEKEIVQKRYDELFKEKTKLLSNLNTLSLALNMAESEKNTSLTKVTGVNNKVKKIEKDNHCMKGKVNLLSQKVTDLEETIVELTSEVEKERDLSTFYEHKYLDKVAELESLNNEFLLYKVKNPINVTSHIKGINISSLINQDNEKNDDIHNLTTEVTEHNEVSAFKVSHSPANYYSKSNSNASPYAKIRSTHANNINPFILNLAQTAKFQKPTEENKENSPWIYNNPLVNKAKKPNKQTGSLNLMKNQGLNLTTHVRKSKNMISLCELLDNNSDGVNSSIKKFKILYEKEKEEVGKFVLTNEEFYIERKNFFTILGTTIINEIQKKKSKNMVNLFVTNFDLQIKPFMLKIKPEMEKWAKLLLAKKLINVANSIQKKKTLTKILKKIIKRNKAKNQICFKKIIRSWNEFSHIAKTASEHSYEVIEKMYKLRYLKFENRYEKELEKQNTIEKLTRKISFDYKDKTENQYKTNRKDENYLENKNSNEFTTIYCRSNLSNESNEACEDNEIKNSDLSEPNVESKDYFFN